MKIIASLSTLTAIVACSAMVLCFSPRSFGQAAGVGQKTFDSPEAAAQAAIEAAEKNDTSALNSLFGATASGILSTGNQAQDKEERTQFAKLARSKHQLEPGLFNSRQMILAVGSQDWPFPVPIVKTSQGKWAFDASLGQTEMRARMIGANELNVMETLAAAVQAQLQYATVDRDGDGILEYAEHLMSTSGKQDGLYWDSAGSKALVPKEFAMAGVDGTSIPAGKVTPYHGYYFRVLKEEGPNAPAGQHKFMVNKCLMGGFGIVAWPDKYGTSGVHTFIVSNDGIIFEKDLGAGRNALTTVTRYDPDKTWKRVD